MREHDGLFDGGRTTLTMRLNSYNLTYQQRERPKGRRLDDRQAEKEYRKCEIKNHFG